MEEKNVENLRDKIDELIPYLNDKNYDFGDIGSELVTKINELESEKIRQYKIIDSVKVKTRAKFFEYFVKEGKQDDFDVIFDDYFSNIFRIERYQNYYLVSFCGTSHMDMNFVFDKNGNLLIEDGIVYSLDDNNFCVIRNNNKNLVDKLYNFSCLCHYQLNDGIFKLVNVLDNVNDIDFNDFFDRDLVVCCSCEDKILYNYKEVEIVIPSFSSLCNDLGNFEVIEGDKLNYIRIVKKLYGVDNYNSILKSKLEFLVDNKGNLASYVYDFANGYSSSDIPYFVNNQEAMLKYVYGCVSKNCDIYKKIKKQN